MWQRPAILTIAANFMSLICGSSALYLATTQGLYAFQLSTGHPLWHAHPKSAFSFIQLLLRANPSVHLPALPRHTNGLAP
jgi:hypothetical protein